MAAEQVKKYRSESTFVPAAPQRQELVPVQMTLPSIIDLLPQAAHSTHARQDDDAMTHARATLLVSAAYIVAAGMITGGLLLVVWLFRGLGDGWATMSQRGWENGIALLKLARVVNGQRWRVHDLPTIERALQKAQDKALETPESFFGVRQRFLHFTAISPLSR